MKTVYEIHRSDALQLLAKVINHAQLFSNQELAELLENVNSYRMYIVKEDSEELKNELTVKTF
jgi:hypothetical protein